MAARGGGRGGSVWGRPPNESAASGDGRGAAGGNGHGSRGNGNVGGGDRAVQERPPEGRRGVRRSRIIPTPAEKNDIVLSRPENTGKSGLIGQQVNLLANYFVLTKKTDWCIYNYHVDFKPDEERTHIRKALLRQQAGVIGSHIFDGATLYTAARLHPEPLLLYSVRSPDQQRFELTVRLTQELFPGDVATIQFFNITLRKCLSAMGLEQVNRHFFDRSKAFSIDDMRLTIWPGYKTSMRNYEHNVLLCVEPTHKVLRQDTVLDVIIPFGNWRNPDVQQKITTTLLGQTVVTSYNGKSYRIDGIDFVNTASGGFEVERNGERRRTSYIEYYRQQYQEAGHITDPDQPLLVSRRTRRDIHRGMIGDILLIPELCQMTGISDAMRSNPGVMRRFADHTNLDPTARIQRIRGFMQQLRTTPEAKDDLRRWGLDFSNDIVSLTGRVIPQENIEFRGTTIFQPKDEPRLKADWTVAFRTHKLLVAPRLSSWVLIVPQRDRGGVDNLIGTMQRVTRTLDFPIDRPFEIMTLPDPRVQTYDATIRTAIERYAPSKNLQMIFVILPNDNVSTYSAVKKLCTLQYGIPSQCFLAKNVNNKGLMSIATKCVVQMCAKLGGEPWSVKNPIPGLTMIIGFDVHHCGSRRGRSVGAMVATTSKNLSRYYSTVSFHENREEISSSICQDVRKCLNAFMAKNEGGLPGRIIMYRDGVGEGQLTHVYNTELEQIKESVRGVYGGAKVPPPRLTFIVVTKRINTRVFLRGPNRTTNPDPGTCVDDVITKPESFDFYLISQTCKMGTTVSPTSYNVLFDQQGVNPDTIQRLTYRLCHLYFNWSGCVAVPAPVQYAHRLAFQTGTCLDRSPHERLGHLLHFL